MSRNRSTLSKAERRRAAAEAARAAQRKHARTVATRWALGVGAIVLAVGVLYAIYTSSDGGESPAAPPGDGAGTLAYQVGSPGPGGKAPEFTLPATDGKSVSLDAYRGKKILLYFHEGGGCQPCWTQIRDFEQRSNELKSAGIDVVLPITTDPVDLHARKLADDGITTVSLSDTDLAVSERYHVPPLQRRGRDHSGTVAVMTPTVG